MRYHMLPCIRQIELSYVSSTFLLRFLSFPFGVFPFYGWAE